jgi:hypothetical protein
MIQSAAAFRLTLILMTAKLRRAQQSVYAHVPQAERAGVQAETGDIYVMKAAKSAPRTSHRSTFRAGAQDAAVSDKTAKHADIPASRLLTLIGGIPGWLRADLDDPQHLHVKAMEDRAAFPSNAEATRRPSPQDRPAWCGGRGVGAACRPAGAGSRKRSSGIGGAIRRPG